MVRTKVDSSLSLRARDRKSFSSCVWDKIIEHDKKCQLSEIHLKKNLYI